MELALGGGVKLTGRPCVCYFTGVVFYEDCSLELNPMNCPGPSARFSAVAGLVAWIALAASSWTVAVVAAAPQIAAQAKPQAAAVDVPWILASEDKPWAVALAAPAAAHLRRSGPGPMVMAIASPPTREAEWLLSLAPGPRPIVLATSAELKLGPKLQARSPEVLQIGSDAGTASAKVARRFWDRSSQVVVATADDPEAVILGSATAAGLDVPLLLCQREEAGAAVSAALQDLSVARLLVAVSDATRSPRWIQSRGTAFEVLPPQALQHRLIAALGAGKVRNVVVARAPDDRAGVGRTAWLGPYLSSARARRWS